MLNDFSKLETKWLQSHRCTDTVGGTNLINPVKQWRQGGINGAVNILRNWHIQYEKH